MRLLSSNSPIPHVTAHTPSVCLRLVSPVILSCMIGALIMATSGCITTHTEITTAALKIEVDTADQIWLYGESYPIDRLPAALKRRRIPFKQSLLIHTPEGDNRALYVRLSSLLRSAGYTRFFFVGDPQAEASVVTPKRVITPKPATNKRLPR